MLLNGAALAQFMDASTAPSDDRTTGIMSCGFSKENFDDLFLLLDPSSHSREFIKIYPFLKITDVRSGKKLIIDLEKLHSRDMAIPPKIQNLEKYSLEGNPMLQWNHNYTNQSWAFKDIIYRATIYDHSGRIKMWHTYLDGRATRFDPHPYIKPNINYVVGLAVKYNFTQADNFWSDEARIVVRSEPRCMQTIFYLTVDLI